MDLFGGIYLLIDVLLWFEVDGLESRLQDGQQLTIPKEIASYHDGNLDAFNSSSNIRALGIVTDSISCSLQTDITPRRS